MLQNVVGVPCPCCGYQFFNGEQPGNYGICPICFWEDDPDQSASPDCEVGANPISLKQAQKNFQSFGACDVNMIRNVRKPSKDDVRDSEWRFIV